MTYVLAALVIAVDQVTKVGYDGPVNAGLAFSEGHGTQSWVQLMIGVVLIIAGLVWAWRSCSRWAFALAAGGLLSLLFDRLFYGGIRDPIAWGPYWWNVADVAATVGVVACVCSAISRQREEVSAP